MKKLFAFLAIAGVMAACNNEDKKAAETKVDSAAAATTAADSAAKAVTDTMAAKVDSTVNK